MIVIRSKNGPGAVSGGRSKQIIDAFASMGTPAGGQRDLGSCDLPHAAGFEEVADALAFERRRACCSRSRANCSST